MKRLACGLLAVLMAACAGAEGDSSTTTAPPIEASSTTSNDQSTTTTSPAPVTSTTTESDAWDTIATWRGGAAGEYRTTSFVVPFRFATTSAWTGSDQIDLVAMSKAPGTGIAFLDMGFDSVEDAVAHFQAMENAEFTEPTATTVGSAAGVSMNGTIVDNQAITRLADGLFLQWAAGSETTLHLVDVEGDIVVILVDWDQPLPPNFTEQTQSILDSIVWRALDG